MWGEIFVFDIMVEKLDHLIIKSEPFYAVEDAELLNGITGQDGDLRTLCLQRLGLSEDTVTLLEGIFWKGFGFFWVDFKFGFFFWFLAQQIDVECLKKMRFEDVDVLFENRPLGPKVHFREALMLWRIEIGLPMRSLRVMAFRKRSGEHDGNGCNGTGPKCSRGQFHGPVDQLGIVTPSTTPELVVKPNKVPPNIDYKQFSWPMTTEVLRDILASCSVGRMILHSAELATLEKSFQSQLTAIMIDYHMAHDTKITAMQLENYSRCITMLFPHENKVKLPK